MKPDYDVGLPTTADWALVILLATVAACPLFSPLVRIITGMVFVFTAFIGLTLVYYSKSGQYWVRDYMLALISWRGDERVLEVGTARGLLLIGAAKKLTTGSAVGLNFSRARGGSADWFVWSPKDMTGKNEGIALRNAELEGVADRVALRAEDPERTSFADASFDVVLCNSVLHHLPSWSQRERTCAEMARVLKPGGVAVVSVTSAFGGPLNIAGNRYLKAFWDAGLKTIWRGPFLTGIGGGQLIIRAAKA